MKIIRCSVMGEVNSVKCYDCFTNALSGENYSTRVLCKKRNVVEEVSMEPESQQGLISLQEATA
jgi:hypothetical protein